MASAVEKTTSKTLFASRNYFPEATIRINVVKFLEATTNLLKVIDCFGKLFAPVKYDIQGNIEKIKKHYTFDEDSCLLELMLDELKKGQNTAAEGALWLSRSLWMFDLIFQEIINHLQANNYDVSMKIIFTIAYEGSVKQYHNWVTQQIFHLICKMAPSLREVIKTFEAENDVKSFERDLFQYNTTLHSVRCKMDDFFTGNGLFGQSKG